MGFIIKEAKRELIYAKTALMGASGAGKTYTALRLATGFLEELKKENNPERIKNGKILMANTEASRGRYYANEFAYDIIDVMSPHNPEMYVELIEYAVEQNYPMLLLDSTSHEWEGRGGCLELHQQAGGTYQAWAKVTPRHDKFIEKIADSEIHIIATMRGKDQYEIEKGDNSRLNVRKLGVGAKQRDGFEYEFTVTFLLDQKSNTAEAQKDNTHLFENEPPIKLTEGHGEKIAKWTGSGEGFTPTVRSTKSNEDVIKELKKEIIQDCKDLGGKENEALMQAIESYDKSGNPNKIKDLEVLQKLKADIEVLKKEKK